MVASLNALTHLKSQNNYRPNLISLKLARSRAENRRFRQEAMQIDLSDGEPLAHLKPPDRDHRERPLAASTASDHCGHQNKTPEGSAQPSLSQTANPEEREPEP